MRRLGALLAVVLLACAAAVALRPVLVHGKLRELSLRASGVRRVRVGSLESWSRDTCEPGRPCACVALLHGLGDSALTWDMLLAGDKGKDLAPPPRGWRLLALDLPGTEGSAPPASPEGYAVRDQAKTVRAALETETRCSSWTVVGNSLGGWVAGWLAADWPRGVGRLVLANPAGLSDPSGRSEAVARVLADPTVEGMKDFSKKAYFDPPKAPERAWPEIIAGIKARPARAMVLAMRPEHVLDFDLERVKAPTAVVWGEADQAIPRAVGERFAKLIPGARFVPVAECGHLPQRECPRAVRDVVFSIRP